MKKSVLSGAISVLLAAALSVTLFSCAKKTLSEQKDAVVEDFSVTFVNVGYGDCAILSGGGRSYMIDTGSAESVYSVICAMNILGIDRLDGVFLTHAHKDHIGGLYAVSGCAEIGTVYSSKITIHDEAGKDKMLSLCEELSLGHSYIGFGDDVPFGDTGAVFRVIGPTVPDKDDENDNSLVLVLKVNGRTLLFTGDMQFSEEATVLKAVGTDGVDCDVLKVGNHGNKDATGDDFAAAASPSVSVISTSTKEDKNSASKRVKKLLSCSDVYVTENFENGITVDIATDGTVSAKELLFDEDAGYAFAPLELSPPDAETQSFTVTNTGDGDFDLNGCFLFIDSGAKIFRFGKRILASGESVTVACKGGDTENADIVWNESFAINTKKEKRAVLYDRYGSVICETRTAIPPSAK